MSNNVTNHWEIIRKSERTIMLAEVRPANGRELARRTGLTASVTAAGDTRPSEGEVVTVYFHHEGGRFEWAAAHALRLAAQAYDYVGDMAATGDDPDLVEIDVASEGLLHLVGPAGRALAAVFFGIDTITDL